MIRNSKRFYDYFRGIYEANCGSLRSNKSFEEVFEDNESRMEFIIEMFDAVDANQLSYSGRRVFEETIEYIVAFMRGDRKRTDIKVPTKYFEDESMGAIIPNLAELDFLLKLIKTNKTVYEMYYKDNLLVLDLPDETFNQNMQRCLEIKDHNLAHLLGLTEFEDPAKPDPSKNILKKYVLNLIGNSSAYGTTDAERVLNWITSDAGQLHLYCLHKKTLEFVKKDKEKYPNAYDSEGNLKPNSATISKFKQRYKASTGLDYPIINFSRFMVKAANTINFLNLNNVVEMILDYNAPEGKTNEKDIFLVLAPARKVLTRNNQYIEARSDIWVAFYEYAFDPTNEAAKNFLIAAGIDLKDPYIQDQLNIIKAREFIEEKGITPDDYLMDEKIIACLNPCFEREVHLLGFKTEFHNETDIPLDEMRVHGAHCDTSISLTVPELVGHYYKRGRPFFLDKIESLRTDQGMDHEYLLISTVRDEINYLTRVEELKADATERIERLRQLREEMTSRLNDHIEGNERRR